MNVSVVKIKRRLSLFVFLAKGLLYIASFTFLCHLNIAKANSDIGNADGTAEYAVKAAYIYNILRFVSWDEAAPLAQLESLNVCLFKDNPFNQYLEPIKNKSIGSKKIKLKILNKISPSSSCHLIFINDNDNFGKKEIRLHYKNSGSILLGNDLNFIKNGGLFGFYIENSKVKLGANRAAITNSELNISSQLIEVCQLYGAQK